MGEGHQIRLQTACVRAVYSACAGHPIACRGYCFDPPKRCGSGPEDRAGEHFPGHSISDDLPVGRSARRALRLWC